LQWLKALIETGHTDNTQLLFEINAVFPESSVVLRKDTLSLREKLDENLSRLAGESGQMDPRGKKWLLLMRAVSLNLLSIAQSEMGLLVEALENASGSVTLIGELAEHDPLVYNPFLAQYLNDFANRQRDLGQDEAALSNYEHSVKLFREIVERDREALPDLAKSVNNLGISLRALGRLDASLQCAEEAVSLYRKLIEENHDKFLPVFAGFLANLSNSQSSVGQRDAALASAKESETYFRELAERNRDAYLPNLARALSNLSVMQSEAGQIEDGLASAEEAVMLLRELTRFSRDVFLLDLSVALNNLAGRQTSAGHGEDALANAREAVDITRELLSRNRPAFIFDHTKSCGRLGLILAELGRHAEAADVFADGFREVLPSLENGPRPPLVRQALLLCAGYLQATEKGGIERDWPLLARAMPILGPHLKELGDQNDQPN
jgi:tetratricopeptide (TPR) repeat protein